MQLATPAGTICLIIVSANAALLRDRMAATLTSSPVSSMKRTTHVQWLSEQAALARYRGPVSSNQVPGGVVHKIPADLRTALIANATALDAWMDITPLARNEFICW